RGPEPPRAYAPLGHGQRRVGLEWTLVGGRELEQPVGWVFSRLGPRSIPDNGVPHSPLGERNGCRSRELPRMASARSLGNQAFVLGQESPRRLRPPGLGVERGERRVPPVKRGYRSQGVAPDGRFCS